MVTVVAVLRLISFRQLTAHGCTSHRPDPRPDMTCCPGPNLFAKKTNNSTVSRSNTNNLKHAHSHANHVKKNQTPRRHAEVRGPEQGRQQSPEVTAVALRCVCQVTALARGAPPPKVSMLSQHCPPRVAPRCSGQHRSTKHCLARRRSALHRPHRRANAPANAPHANQQSR